HVIIHEGGHLVCGLISGWKYLSFRVGNLTLVKQDGKLKCKKTTVAGTGGQCLMIPPQCEPEKCPFFLYLLGGGLANLLTGGLAFLAAIPLGGIAEIILTIFGILGIGLGLSNLFPAKMSGTMNDGYQIFIELPKNNKAKENMCCLLTANAVLSENESTNALPENIRNVILALDGEDFSDTSATNLLFFKTTILQEEGRYEEAEAIFKKVTDSPDALQIFKNEAACELIYHEIMGECNAEKIEKLADKKLMEYINATALYPSRKRLMYAYYLIYKNDTAKADEEYQALLKTAKSHPSKAEGAIELKEAERIRAYYDNKRAEPKA
ncbi:MAG: hypothetical protein IJ385_04870, partial [Ruminiclostridium sp.]|nr:hypothetical protein [Ruminiclostridium sp.]